MNGGALTQVAVIAASCCVGHICMVGGGGGCSCMLLLHPVPTSADAGPDLCTLCPDLCTLHPDLWTLSLWCFPSFNWCKYSTCTGGGCHQLQLALVVLFHSATSADSPLAHVVVSPSCNLRWWCFFIQPLAQILHLHPGQLALCGGGQWWYYIYIIFLELHAVAAAPTE